MAARWAVTTPNTLRVCTICCRSPGDGIKLMKCNGCIDPPTYCSKECQKAHWPSHKPYCKQLSTKIVLDTGPSAPPAALNGFASPMDLMQTLTDYISAHQWALEAVSKINAFLMYGHDLDNPDKFITRFVFTRTNPAVNIYSNPTHMFTFHRFEILGEEDAQEICRASTARMDPVEHYKRTCPSHARLPDGAMFAVCMMEGNLVHQKTQSFPWYRPNPNRLPTMFEDYGRSVEQRKALLKEHLEELREVCLRSLNTDLPLRSKINLGLTHLQMPVPGRYKRVRKEWIWEPLFANWDDYVKGRTQCGPLYALGGLKKNRSPEHLMWLYYDL